HAAQARRPRRRELQQRSLAEIARVVAGLDLLSRPRECGAGGLDRQPGRLAGEPFVARELVDGRQVAELHLAKCRPADREARLECPCGTRSFSPSSGAAVGAAVAPSRCSSFRSPPREPFWPSIPCRT